MPRAHPVSWAVHRCIRLVTRPVPRADAAHPRAREPFRSVRRRPFRGEKPTMKTIHAASAGLTLLAAAISPAFAQSGEEWVGGC